MFLPLILSLILIKAKDEPASNPAPTLDFTPHPTSKSGIPTLPTIFGCTIGAICFIALCVSFLCFRKEQQQGFAQSAQILLEKNDI
ncbi:hypothetical protein M9Y10_022451 [Tritrichomonas musculus]|uniref:Uncharacterized protein n=1 Tax=Tritrichomonas musculus TaxID=1915356 RepID=A0ABR2KSF2_9EUKA